MLQKIEKYSILTYLRGRKNLSVIQKKTLQNTDEEGGRDSFFLTQKKEGQKGKQRRERAEEVLGEKFYEELLEIK